MRGKMEADHYDRGPGTSKRSKTGDMYYADKHQDFLKDLGKVGPSSISRIDNLRYNEIGLSANRQCSTNDQTPAYVKKGDGQTQVLDVGSLDKRQNGRRENFRNKRKLMDCEDIKNCQNSALDGLSVKEENSVSGLRKEKKPRALKTEDKICSSRGGDNNSNRNASQIYSSGSRNCTAIAEEVRCFDKDQEIGKHSKKAAAQKIMDSGGTLETLEKDLGSKQVSVVATSSSSKVSGTCKTKASVEEVKGFLGESMSSPLRVSSNGVLNQSVRVWKEKVPSDIHPKFHKFPTLEVGDGNLCAKV